MTGRLLRLGVATLALTALASGCTSDRATPRTDNLPAGSFRLVAFDSCEATLTELRAAAKAVVQPYGLPGNGPIFAAAEGGVKRDGAVAGAPTDTGSGSSNFSGTNTHEAGVDEPDLVKTDGHRIVTVSGGVLRVIDAATKRVTGKIDLATALPGGTNDGMNPDFARYIAANLLLAGDHALVLVPAQYFGFAAARMATQPTATTGAQLLLVDLTGAPRVISRYGADGDLVDARQVGGVVRIVLRSAPRITFPYLEQGTDADRIKANKKIIDKSTLDDWLPRYEIATGKEHRQGRVDCGAVQRPANYTGANLLTVVTVDLSADRFDSGDPITIVADGDTVYSNGTSLYIAADQRWRVMPMMAALAPEKASDNGANATSTRAQPQTQIYKFDTSAAGRPRFVAGGGVPGYLVNQYAMSEWDGRLRVATTSGEPWGGETAQPAESGVFVLAPREDTLAQVGHVGGLGRGERIYAVRFTGATGYVVTFRQTDPLYVVDLSDPARPTVRGELKISGYSAYLHPAGDNRLIGIGQEASEQGRTQGLQVSLFDVANPAQPAMIARYHLADAHSQAEFDPHAFLYWPADGLLVVPVETYPTVAAPPATATGPDTTVSSPGAPSTSALLLRVAGDTITSLGTISHPGASTGDYSATITRSLRIGGTLWTVSDRGVLATDATSLVRAAWLAY